MNKSKDLLLIVILCFCMDINGLSQGGKLVTINSINDLELIGQNLVYFEDVDGNITSKDIIGSDCQKKFKQSDKDIFARPATSSVFWFKFSVENKSDTDIWLEVGSTYAWYIDFYEKDSLGQLKLIAETGTMRPEKNKFYDYNLFWLPLNEAGENSPKTYYLRISASLPLELPLHIGTIKSLTKNRDISNYLTAGFVGLIVIIFLYSLFIYISTKDHVYIWYLGYLLLMGISMPYANSHPFIQKLEFLFFDKEWWNNYFLVWHAPVYFFVGMFCIKYLNLKEKLPLIYRLILVEITLLSIIAPLLNISGIKLVVMINTFQAVVLLLYLTCLITAYYLMFKGNKYARYYVLGWTFMIVNVFIFFATVNGYFPFSNFSRNALYVGVGLEVWMFSLALGDRINIIRKEKELAQAQYVELVESQNETLQLNVKERTSQLENALEEVEAANSELMTQTEQLAEYNRTKDKLLSIIGHDLKGPIGALKVLLELAVKGDLDKEGFKNIARKFHIKVDNILFLLNNLLQWANSQRVGIVTKPVSVGLSQLINQNINLLSQNVENKEINVTNKVLEEIDVWCDKTQLKIVILNLLNNAIKFTSKNGSIEIDAKKAKNNYLQVSISDTGIGMDNGTVRSLFDPFLQISKTGTDGEEGTGLGLAVCKDFIEASGGRIWVESERMKGSTFYFTLPMSSS